MEPRLSWQLSGTNALLQSDSIRLTVDVSKPSAGISSIQVGDCSLPGWSLLGLEIPCSSSNEPTAEHYVRGSDLIATYLQTPDRTVRPQLYWRAFQAPQTGVELVVSMQTSLLESRPMVSVGSTLCDGELFRFDGTEFHAACESVDTDAHLVVFRANGASFSYVEIIHPTDSEKLHIHVDDQTVTTRFGLFHHDLEKGVIRRGRLRSHFVPRQDDFETAVQLLSDLASSPAPLTT